MRRAVGALIRKDLRLELRTWETVPAMVLFAPLLKSIGEPAIGTMTPCDLNRSSAGRVVSRMFEGSLQIKPAHMLLQESPFRGFCGCAGSHSAPLPSSHCSPSPA